MDNLTHTLFGITLANLGWQQKHGRIATWGLAVAANLPDVDAVTRLWGGTEGYLAYHRTLTHSVAGLVLLPLLLAVFLRLFNRTIPFRTLYLIGFAGVMSHIGLDLLTGWGTMLFYPFITQRFSLPWVFIIDAYVLGTLLVATIAFLSFPGYRKALARGALALLVVYAGFCGWNWTLALDKIGRVSAEHGYRPVRIRAFAQPFTPLEWMGVIQEKNEIHLLKIRPLAPLSVGSIESHPTHLDQKEVRAALQTREARHFLAWSELPVASVENGNGWHRVVISDLRFRSRFRPRPPFALTIDLNEELRPVRTMWSRDPSRKA
jgi:inner membrane protein